MQTVTKKQLTDAIADATGIKRVLAKDIIQRFLDMIAEELARGNRIEFRDFGVFEVKRREPRVAQNPRTLERVPLGVRYTVRFKPGRRMSDDVQDGNEAVAAGASAETETEAAGEGPAAARPEAAPRPASPEAASGPPQDAARSEAAS